MPLCALLWIIAAAPCLALLVLAFALIRDKGDEFGNEMVQVVVFLIIVTALAAPNLMWYKAVRDVMFAEREVTLSQPLKVEADAPMIAHPELMVQ